MNEINSPDAKGQDPLIGRTVNDRYKILSVIARGGMGKVYRAEQAPLGRLVALKVLSPNYQGDSDVEFHKRFFLEASISAKLTHPNTVTVFDYGRTDDDIFYIAMELLEGRTLHRAIRDEGPFLPERAAHIARQICRSLREAHSMNVIHRDLKPANVYLVQHGDENDFVKVLDFGLVKDVEKEGEDLTQTGLFMGSPKYMAPEQIRGERVDGRTDVYALGVLFYEMLTGKVPFDRPNSVNILMAHVHENAPSMNAMLPGTTFAGELEAIVMKAMAKKPDDRYASMDEFANAIKQAGAGAMMVSRTYDLSSSSSISGSLELDAGAALASHSGIEGHTLGGSVISRAAPPKSSNAPKLVAGVVVLAAIVGGGLAYMNRTPAVAPPPPTVATSPDVVTPPPTPPPTPGAPTFDTVAVELRSEPAGAKVLVSGVELGTTPTQIEWTGTDATFGREVVFTFRLDGYRDYTVMRTVRNDTINVLAHLEPAPTAGRRPGGTTRPPAGGLHGTPAGYMDVPY